MNIPNIKFTGILTFLMLLLFQSFSWSQQDKELLAELVMEEQDAVNALIMYPADTRLAIFNSTPYPEALIKMESLQSRTSNSFIALLENYPQETQQMIWDLTRYPKLISRLVAAGAISSERLEMELANYDKVIHPRAKAAHARHFSLLSKINELEQSAETTFATIIHPYPSVTQDALRELKDLPEVLTLLIENIRLTVLVGAIYVDDPEWLITKADSLHLVVAQQNAQEVNAWKRSVEEDPEALEELQASTENYAEEYGYDDDYYDYDHDYDSETSSEVIVRHHYYYNYPYWFGYPTWYTIPRWRCTPLYYDWGFYSHPGFNIVIIGMPTYHYTQWYFYNHHHHYYWPHLSQHFVNHYHGHRTSPSSITTSVTIWQNQNREVITREWLRNDEKLTSRFKDFGQFESAREKYNKANPGKKISQKDFAKQQVKTFPELAKNAERYEQQGNIRKPVTRPPVSTPRTTKQKVTPPKKTTTTRPPVSNPRKPTIRKVEPPKTSRPTAPKTTRKPPMIRKPAPKKTSPRKKMPAVKKGENHHQQTWDKSKTQRKPTAPRAPQKITKPKVKKPTSGRKKTVGD